MFEVSRNIQAGGRELQDRAEFFWCGSNLVLVLADGAGGMGGGAEAAAFIVGGIKDRIASLGLDLESLSRLVTSLDLEMAASGACGEATCVVAVLSETGLFGASVGDSGAFVLTGTGPDNLSANQLRKPPIGSGQAISVGFAREFLDGILLIASDVLLKYTSLDKIAETIRTSDFQSAANRLIELVRYKSGALPDDVAVLLARRK